jgi:hypothetical protein
MDIPQDFFWLVECTPFDLHLYGASQLTVDAGIGAYLGRDIVDSQTAPQTPGWNWSESDHVVNLLND